MNDLTDQPLPQLPPRDFQSHKGDYGRVLVIGGSRGMAGAPALAGRAALRSGAGLVTLAVPRSIQNTVASFEPSYMTLGLGDRSQDLLTLAMLETLLDAAGDKASLALGPGLGRDESTCDLVHELYRHVSAAMVVDADALNALASQPELLDLPGGPRILTPHPGEFARLTGERPSSDTERAAAAAALARRSETALTVVVLKGHHTVVTDGKRYAINQTGNPGMATGGTGDCLTGIIASLVGQGMECFEAARLGVHLHGLAGDLAAEALGMISLTASDLIDYLPGAFRSV